MWSVARSDLQLFLETTKAWGGGGGGGGGQCALRVGGFGCIIRKLTTNYLMFQLSFSANT